MVGYFDIPHPCKPLEMRTNKESQPFESTASTNRHDILLSVARWKLGILHAQILYLTHPSVKGIGSGLLLGVGTQVVDRVD